MTNQKQSKAVRKDFEESLINLEKIVEELERGELPLDESIKKFESGVKLYKECKKILNNSEEKIKILAENLEEDDF